MAAPTTSLPERPGGVRNWDYRYCWLRDAAFTVAALDDCGFQIEGGAFVDWMLYATRLTHPSLQILYDVFGEARLPESILGHLEGYDRSAPVRIGNDAHHQFQLDVYGEVLGAVEEHFQRNGDGFNRDVQGVLCRIADVVVRRWKEPDSGIWEKRSARQQHVHAKVMAWAALDCVERLVKKSLIRGVDTLRWQRTKDEIRDTVLEHGFNREIGSFVAILDGDELDASLLSLSRVGFLKSDEFSHLVAAWRAPRRPEIDDKHFAAPLIETLLAPFRVGQRDVEQRRAVGRGAREPNFAGDIGARPDRDDADNADHYPARDPSNRPDKRLLTYHRFN